MAEQKKRIAKNSAVIREGGWRPFEKLFREDGSERETDKLSHCGCDKKSTTNKNKAKEKRGERGEGFGPTQ